MSAPVTEMVEPSLLTCQSSAYGTAAALKFGQLLDPALQHDLYADKPYALVRLPSALLCPWEPHC